MKEDAKTAEHDRAPEGVSSGGVTGYCTWKYHEDGEFWESACDQGFTFNEGGPIDNEFRYCFYCGKQISEAID